MTFGKAALLTTGFIGAMALGVWVGPHITQRDAPPVDVQATQVEPAPVSPAVAPTTAARKPRSRPAATSTASRSTPAAAEPVATVAVSAPELHKVLKPILRPGANMSLASEGFGSAEEFAATAHAARNTDVPFMVLKHRVVDERKSLADAIRESKPDVNAEVAANLARAEARADLSSLD